MTGVSPARAALVTQPYAIAVEDDPSLPGREATMVLAIASAGGAADFLARVFPLSNVGLGAWALTIFGGAGLYELGDEVTLVGSGFGAAADGIYIVVSCADKLGTGGGSGDADLVVQGPQPEES